MPGASTNAQKWLGGLWKGDYIKESDIIKIIKPKYIKVYQHINGWLEQWENLHLNIFSLFIYTVPHDKEMPAIVQAVEEET